MPIKTEIAKLGKQRPHFKCKNSDSLKINV